MKLYVLAVGVRMPAWVDAGFRDYTRRMPREARIELIEIKPEKRDAGKTPAQVLEAERARIEAAIPRDVERVVLDEHGEACTTAELAALIRRWMNEGRSAAFVIGGADGLHPEIKNTAAKLLSLSVMTLPHGLARVMLAEQLYRAITLIRNHPYHRD